MKSNIEAPNVSQTEASNDDARAFTFFEHPDGIKIEVVTKSLAKFSELKQEVFGMDDPFPKVSLILNAFEKARVSGKISDTTLKRPHILICGGFVRDALMGVVPNDIDLVTNATYEETESILKQEFEEQLANNTVTIDNTGKQFNVVRLAFRESETSPREEYEIATFRSPAREGDLPFEQGKRPGIDALHRDITINGLLYNPRTGTVIDYVGGLEDIANRKLRFTGDPQARINEDAIQSLRYVRFLFKTGFQEDHNGVQAIKANAHESVRRLTPDRIMQELSKMLRYEPYGDVVATLQKFNLLKEVLPEVAKMEEILHPKTNQEVTESEFEHTRRTMNNLLPRSSLELVLAGLFHDIGKQTTQEDIVQSTTDNQPNGTEHIKRGLPIMQTALTRLRFPTKLIANVAWLIENHLQILDFASMRESRARTLAEHPHFQDLVTLAQAFTESLTQNGLSESEHALFSDINKRYREIVQFTQDNANQLQEIRRIVDGKTIMETYKGIHGNQLRGQHVGILKNKITDMITDARIVDPQIARELMIEEIKKYTAS